MRQHHIVWLRINYWIGALFDGVMLIPLLKPKIAGLMFGIDHFEPSSAFRYASCVAASLMAGWTCLLLWADRRPLERKDVAFLTLVPVLSGLILSGIYAIRSGLIKPVDMLPTFIIQGLLFLSYFCSYIYAYIRERH